MNFILPTGTASPLVGNRSTVVACPERRVVGVFPDPDYQPFQMILVCSYCSRQYGSKPCCVQMHGQVSHGACPECFEIEMRKIEGTVAA